MGVEGKCPPEPRPRLGVPAEDNTAYNQALADAVKKYQAEKKLGGNGVLNQATIDTINGPHTWTMISGTLRTSANPASGPYAMAVEDFMGTTTPLVNSWGSFTGILLASVLLTDG